MKNILLCGLKYDRNFGDPIINESSKYLIKKSLEDNNIKYNINELDMTGRYEIDKKYTVKNNFILIVRKIINKMIKILKKGFKLLNCKVIYNWLDMINWYFTDEYMIYKQYYINKVKEADVIIFVGGGIVKYKYQEFYHYIDFISKYAEKYKKPVYLNSIGVEGYDDTNVKCRLLKNALNRDCIKKITTRDDITNLKKYVYNGNIKINKVCDPAVYTSNAYDIKKDTKSEIIGLGVCRENLFKDNEIQFTGEDLIKLWVEIINELDKKNIKWKIYTNGLDADNNFAYKLIEKLKFDNKKDKIVIPKRSIELVKIISEFKGVIATRLHSCIVSYSLEIPAIGLVWNDKLKMFGESINYPERFMQKSEFKAKDIVERMEKAIYENYEKTNINYKESIYKEIDDFIKTSI